MANQKASVDVVTVHEEREHVGTPDGDVFIDIEKIPSGYRWVVRDLEENVLQRQIGRGVTTVEKAKETALRRQPPKVKNSSKSGAPTKAPKTKRRKSTNIDQAVEALFVDGIKPAYRHEVDKVLVELVKKAGA